MGGYHNTGLCSKYASHVELLYFCFLLLWGFVVLPNWAWNKVGAVVQPVA